MARPIELEDPFEDDPFLAFQKRGPLPKLAAARVIALADRASAEKVFSSAEALGKLLANRKRPVELVAATFDDDGRAATLERCLQGGNEPMIIVTTAIEPWSAGQLDAMLEAIDRCDHVIGIRKIGPFARVVRFLKLLAWRIVFACPWRDVHSPCRLHRREKLAEIPCQSKSAFLNVEIAAKATFLGHLLDETEIPALAGIASRVSFADVARVFRAPEFKARNQLHLNHFKANKKVPIDQAAKIAKASQTTWSKSPAPSSKMARRALSNCVKGSA